MPKLPSVSGERAIRALKRAGFVELRQKASHVSLEKRIGEQVLKTVVPMHSELAKGLADILKRNVASNSKSSWNSCNTYRFAACSMTYAFTVSNASAAFVNRRAANASSISRKKLSRSASLANSTATPRSLSGVPVGVARKPLTLNPRSPGSVAHPNW
jgi:predicted RNA binding protein YcfA (HicA-like mRNA interferase family)